VPEDRLNFRRQASDEVKNGAAAERNVVMAPSNVEFFYAAEETSERIWRIDRRLN